MANGKWQMANLQKGQSLFEAVVALAISALIIVAVVALVASSIRNASFSRNVTLASRYAQQATEWLRGQRDANAGIRRKICSLTYCLKFNRINRRG